MLWAFLQRAQDAGIRQGEQVHCQERGEREYRRVVEGVAGYGWAPDEEVEGRSKVDTCLSGGDLKADTHLRSLEYPLPFSSASRCFRNTVRPQHRDPRYQCPSTFAMSIAAVATECLTQFLRLCRSGSREAKSTAG